MPTKRNDTCQTEEEIISLFGTQEVASIQPHLCPPIAPFPTDSTASFQVATAIRFYIDLEPEFTSAAVPQPK